MQDYNEFVKQKDVTREVGSCEFMDIESFIRSANVLVASDEPVRAIALLDNLPGYYRDHPPKEVAELKKEIRSKLATPAFYMGNIYDQYVRADNAEVTVETTLRGQRIFADVQKFNVESKSPHIVDLGPGEYWLPIGLWKKRCLFTYQDVGLCIPAKTKALEYIRQFYTDVIPKDRPKIFVACELIEHLHNESDIAVDFHRLGVDADIIHMSTPLYTFDGRKEQIDWRSKGDLGHLRTYTPKEFYNVVTGMFRDYNWELTVSNIMHMRGIKH